MNDHSVGEDDLRPVLNNLLAEKGANGPDGAMTRQMLECAAAHLARELSTVGGGPYRVLSALVGHETFVRKVMRVSVHNMRRRWVNAAEWYDDVIAYALRPARFHANQDRAVREAVAWARRPLGDFMALIAADQIRVTREAEGFRLSEALMALWPDHPPVARSRHQELEWTREHWVPFYFQVLAHYGLRPNPDADWSVIAVAGAAMVSIAARDGVPDPGASWVSEAGLYLVVAGSLNLDGSHPTLEELRGRLSPVAGDEPGS